jgi:hypothetical protein
MIITISPLLSRGDAVVEALRTNRKVAGSSPDGFIGIFHWQSFRPHYGPEVD